MIAVIHGRKCVYLGDSQQEAFDIFKSKSKSTMMSVDTLKDLQEAMRGPQAETSSDVLSRVLQNLEDQGVDPATSEEIYNALKERSNKFITDVKSIGVRGKQFVGDRVATLSQFMKHECEQEERNSVSEGDCCQQTACSHSLKVTDWNDDSHWESVRQKIEEEST